MSPFFEALFNKISKKNSVKTQMEDISNPERNEFSETRESLLQPKLPGVKSVKKNLVISLLLLFSVIFVISFMYSMKKKDIPASSNQNAPTSMQGKENDTQLSYSKFLSNNNNGKPTNGNANGYGPNGLNPNNAQNNQNEPIAITRIPNTPNYESARYSNGQGNGSSMPSGGYGYVPYLSNPYMQNMNQQNHQSNETIPKENYLRSAIGFNIGSSEGNGGGAQTNSSTGSYSGTSTYYSASQNTLTAGSFIPVTLLTGIDSDLPSQVICQVRENVYDSITGEMLLIPQGAKIIGDVNNGTIGAAQERIAVVWKRMILPNGYSVSLGNMPGVDSAGYPGLKDRVNNHEGKVLGATLLTSLMSAAAQIAAGNTSSSNESANQLAVSGAAANVLNAGSKMLEKNININPTIQISPGTVFNILVNQDLILRPYE